MRVGTATCAALLVLPQAAQAKDSLEQILAQRKDQLAAINQQIEAVAGPDFSADRDLQITLRTAILQAWADKISVPQFQINAVGTKVESELVYKPGKYKIWLSPPEHVTASTTFSPFKFQSFPGKLEFSSDLVAKFGARIFFDAYGVKGNIYCDADKKIKGVRANFAISASSPANVHYVATLEDPKKLVIRIQCHLGPLGSYPIDIPMDDIAQKIAEGDMSLAYADTIEIPVPGAPEPLKVHLETANSSVAIDALGIEAKTDILVAPGLRQ